MARSRDLETHPEARKDAVSWLVGVACRKCAMLAGPMMRPMASTMSWGMAPVLMAFDMCCFMFSMSSESCQDTEKMERVLLAAMTARRAVSGSFRICGCSSCMPILKLVYDVTYICNVGIWEKNGCGAY